jgi:hypothetical protein
MTHTALAGAVLPDWRNRRKRIVARSSDVSLDDGRTRIILRSRHDWTLVARSKCRFAAAAGSGHV